MGARIVDGRALAAAIHEEVRAEVARLGTVPRLAVVLVGDDPASRTYVRTKHRACAKAGIESLDLHLPADTSEAELLERIDGLNADPSVHGILVQLPLPPGIDPRRVAERISPEKDVDGLHPLNAGRLLAGKPTLVPCTPAGILEILDRHGVAIEGREAVVVGRSDIVGKPVACLLLHRHATVTLCHSRTRDLAQHVGRAEILVVAMGRPRAIPGSWIRPGAAVIDVGINRTDAGLVGDVDFEGALERAGLLTPVPGGVGPLTVAMLLRNTVEACRRLAGAGAP